MANYITDAQLKTYLGIGDLASDATVAAAVSSGSRRVEGICGGRVFYPSASPSSRTFEVNPRAEIHPIDDCSTIVSVKVDSAGDGSYATTLTPNLDYLSLPLNGVGPSGASGWPTTHLKISWAQVVFQSQIYRFLRIPYLQVNGTWGWSAYPDEVVQATYLLAARYLARRGISDYGLAGAPYGDEDVMELLQPYTRVLYG